MVFQHQAAAPIVAQQRVGARDAWHGERTEELEFAFEPPHLGNAWRIVAWRFEQHRSLILQASAPVQGIPMMPCEFLDNLVTGNRHSSLFGNWYPKARRRYRYGSCVLQV